MVFTLGTVSRQQWVTGLESSQWIVATSAASPSLDETANTYFENTCSLAILEIFYLATVFNGLSNVINTIADVEVSSTS